MSALDPVSQLFVTAFKFSVEPKRHALDLRDAAEGWLAANPNEISGEIHALADYSKDAASVPPVGRDEAARLVGISLDRALKEHQRRLTASGIPPATRWDERADLQ